MMKELINVTIKQQLEKNASLFPTHPALMTRDTVVTYQEFDQLTDQAAAGFLACGLKPDDHAAILGEPDIPLLISFFALQKAGIVVFLLNTCLTAREIAEQTDAADCHYLIIGKSFKNVNYMDELACVQDNWLNELSGVFCLENKGQDNILGLSEILCFGGTPEAASLLKEAEKKCDIHRPALMLSTSGTTGGRPKLVVLSMFHLVNGGIQKADALKITEADVICCAMPIFHIFCIDVNVMAALMSGACLCIPESRRSRVILKTIEERKCSVLSAVPSIFYALISRLKNENFDISSLRIGMTGGAYCPPERFCQIEEKLSFTLLSGLGQTEAAAGISITDCDDALELRSRSVGRIVPYMQGKIIKDASGEEAGNGEPGELCIRGKMLMLGYYKADDLTKAVYDDLGWMHTGDIGYFDEEGNLFLIGRAKDMINRGGEKINPNEIERVLMKHPCVQACKVVPVPDPHYGEQVCAVIQTDQGHEVFPKDIEKIARLNLAEYKIPAYYVYTDHLPRTATGKFKQTEIIRMAAKALGLEVEQHE